MCAHRCFVCWYHSFSLSPWVLDSGAIDLTSGNKSLFKSFSTFGLLPFVTMSNVSWASSHGVGTSIFLVLSLYCQCPFYVLNLHLIYYLNLLIYYIYCLISFTKDSILFTGVQDMSPMAFINYEYLLLLGREFPSPWSS